jgi:hypothetical protein
MCFSMPLCRRFPLLGDGRVTLANRRLLSQETDLLFEIICAVPRPEISATSV